MATVLARRSGVSWPSNSPQDPAIAAAAIAAQRQRRWAGMLMGRRSPFSVLLLMSACAVHCMPATESELDQLEGAACAGQGEAIRKLFDLRRRSDGAVAEAIDMVLGVCARRVPLVFLEELAGHGSLAGLDHMLGNCGPELVDMLDAQGAELAARRDALLTVDVASLREPRDACVSTLQRMIDECHDAEQQANAAGGRRSGARG